MSCLREKGMRAVRDSVRVVFIVAALSLLSSAQIDPCDLSRPEHPRPPDPTLQQPQQQDLDVSGRAAQMDCVQKEINKSARELGTKHAAERAEFKAQFESLKIYGDALLQLATDLKTMWTKAAALSFRQSRSRAFNKWQ